jgi:hypothetical protein
MADIIGFGVASVVAQFEALQSKMLPANVRNKACHVIDRVGWWVKEQFYSSIAIEGPNPIHKSPKHMFWFRYFGLVV